MKVWTDKITLEDIALTSGALCPWTQGYFHAHDFNKLPADFSWKANILPTDLNCSFCNYFNSMMLLRDNSALIKDAVEPYANVFL